MSKHNFLFTILLFIATACSNKFDSRLTEINNLATGRPQDALARLDSLDSSTLSTQNRHYYDLLRVKAMDKAYITHTSDSLIMDVLEYAEKNQKLGIYPEALYYAGRVSSDLGDYPSALKYFQEALPRTTEPGYRTLRGHLLSQTGRLLTWLNLFEQAIPYIKEVLTIDSLENDSFNLAYDYQLLGSILMHQKKYDEASQVFAIAKDMAENLGDNDWAHMQMYQAVVEYKRNNIDSALVLIRHLPSIVAKPNRELTTLYATDIYLAAGKPDTARMYALQLAESPNPDTRKRAYDNLLSPELINFIPKDSVVIYMGEYKSLLSAYLKKHEDRQCLIQNAQFNYQSHVQKRIQAEESKNKMIVWIHILTWCLIIFVIILLIIKTGDRKRKKEVHRLRQKLETLQSLMQETGHKEQEDGHTETPEWLRLRLKEELTNLSDKVSKPEISRAILDSSIYTSLIRFINDKKAIGDHNPFWNELENTVSNIFPNFKSTLQILAGGSLKPHEMHTILLLKCGFTPSQISVLMGKTKGTITNRRDSLCYKILGEKLSAQALDKLVLLL